jgi:hypothetical protein
MGHSFIPHDKRLLRHFKQRPDILGVEMVNGSMIDDRIGNGVVVHPGRMMGKA